VSLSPGPGVWHVPGVMDPGSWGWPPGVGVHTPKLKLLPSSRGQCPGLGEMCVVEALVTTLSASLDDKPSIFCSPVAIQHVTQVARLLLRQRLLLGALVWSFLRPGLRRLRMESGLRLWCLRPARNQGNLRGCTAGGDKPRDVLAPPVVRLRRCAGWRWVAE